MKYNRQKRDFHKVRGGDRVTVLTSDERRKFISAFINWKRDRPGTLRAASRKVDGGYVIEFTGISPAEFTQARMAAGVRPGQPFDMPEAGDI